MSKNDPERNKDGDEQFHYCGSREIIGRNDENAASDGLRGTLHLTNEDQKRLSAEPGAEILLRAEANGKSIREIREIHSDGRSLSLTKNQRQRLDLQPGDEIELWATTATNGEQETLTSTEDGEETKQPEDFLAIRFSGSDVYHRIRSEDADQTVCGVSVGEKDAPIGEEPETPLITLCSDCEVRTEDQLSNKKVAEWLADKAGFEVEDRPWSYFNQEQINDIREYVVDLQDMSNQS